MAFVCKSERVLKFNPTDAVPKTFEDNSNSKLGPGTYFGHKEFTVAKPSIVPFQSSKNREINEVININPGINNFINKILYIGPGEYQYPIGFDS